MMRYMIDFAAVFAATVLGIAATDSRIAGVFTGAAVAAYGMWCFLDGLRK
jgi:hypothetical protein